MSHRVRVSSMPKRRYNKIKSLPPDQFFEFYLNEIKSNNKDSDIFDDCYLDRKTVPVYELFDNEIYDFGDTSFDLPKRKKLFFKNKESRKLYDDYNDFILIDKDLFRNIILKKFIIKVNENYKNMLEPFRGEDGFLETRSTFTFNEDTFEEEINFDFFDSTEKRTALYKMFEHVRLFGSEWMVNMFKRKSEDISEDDIMMMSSLDLREDTKCITTSWKYEYSLFELVRIWKTFDWKSNILILYGW